jgi:uncharacterized protein YndB with AHSA1/START domain
MTNASPESTSDRDRLVVRVQRRFQASAERMFAAWLDPVNIGKWLFKTADGEMIRVEVDPRVGGSFAIVEKRGDILAEHIGKYIVIEPPHRLVFSFTTDKESDPTIVTIEITPLADGCDLALSHPLARQWADWLDRARSGWTMILENLDSTIELQQTGR